MTAIVGSGSRQFQATVATIYRLADSGSGSGSPHCPRDVQRPATHQQIRHVTGTQWRCTTPSFKERWKYGVSYSVFRTSGCTCLRGVLLPLALPLALTRALWTAAIPIEACDGFATVGVRVDVPCVLLPWFGRRAHQGLSMMRPPMLGVLRGDPPRLYCPCVPCHPSKLCCRHFPGTSSRKADTRSGCK